MLNHPAFSNSCQNRASYHQEKSMVRQSQAGKSEADGLANESSSYLEDIETFTWRSDDKLYVFRPNVHVRRHTLDFPSIPTPGSASTIFAPDSNRNQKVCAG